MNKYFSFIMPNQDLARQLGVAFLLIILIAGVGGAVLLAGYSWVIATIWFGVVLMGSLSAIKPIMRKHGSERVQITITDHALRVLNQKSGVEKQVPFGKVVAYRFTKMETGQELCLTLDGKQRLRLSINTEFHKNQDLSGLVRAVKGALGRHQREQGLPKVDLRKKTFFERPVATVLLVVLAVGMVWMTGMLIFSDKPAKGSTFLAYGGFFSYAGAWLSARK